MDDTIIDMREVFLERKIKNLTVRDQELLNEISIALKSIMGNVDLYLTDKDDHNTKQKKLRTVRRCCKEIDEFIKGNRF